MDGTDRQDDDQCESDDGIPQNDRHQDEGDDKRRELPAELHCDAAKMIKMTARIAAIGNPIIMQPMLN